METISNEVNHLYDNKNPRVPICRALVEHNGQGLYNSLITYLDVLFKKMNLLHLQF
ncbi:MAG: hypothetical protein IPO23_03040 [Flavobacterium sp.]|nr:hypothetical protein [Flavobacterium sp.]